MNDILETKWQLIGLAESVWKEAAKMMPVQAVLEHAEMQALHLNGMIVIQWSTPECDIVVNHKRKTIPQLTGGMQWTEVQTTYAEDQGYIEYKAENFAARWWRVANENTQQHEKKWTVCEYREVND